ILMEIKPHLIYPSNGAGRTVPPQLPARFTFPGYSEAHHRCDISLYRSIIFSETLLRYADTMLNPGLLAILCKIAAVSRFRKEYSIK
ncbi:MAG: hypothetical protein ABSH41_19485, partial [Syntrophobacteraceae bacterium]